jgi:hypothetical protein
MLTKDLQITILGNTVSPYDLLSSNPYKTCALELHSEILFYTLESSTFCGNTDNLFAP